MLVLLLIVMPLAEIAVILAMGRAIGGWPTFFLLLFESFLGAWLMKREGRSAWRALSEALRSGRMPARELTDGALILLGGALLLTPGFLTDIVGFFAIAPPTRPIARRMLQRTVERRLLSGGPWPTPGGAAGWSGGAATWPGATGPHSRSTGPQDRRTGEDSDVIEGEVL